MDREQPEVIERQMEQTRESLTEKVSLLEQKVVGQIQSATDAVQETVQCVKSAVQDTVQTVTGTVTHSVQSLTDGVKEVLDVRKHTRENPWAMVGGAAAAGFVTGLLVFRRESSGAALPAYQPMPFTSEPAGGGRPAAPAASHRPAWLNDLFETAGQEIRKLAEQAMATATASLRQTVQTGIPKLIERAVPDVGACRADQASGDGAGHADYYGNGPSSYTGTRR
jgi:ElaB/YqjD/DUF883 family membrane-anchored ribosome-binding protein